MTALLIHVVVYALVAVSGCSPTVGVNALLEYLNELPHKAGSLEWMSAIKAAVTVSASRLG